MLQVSPPHMTKANLVFFSEYAARQIAAGGAMDNRLVKFAPDVVTLPGQAVDQEAAKKTCAWIADNDINSPKEQTVAGMKLETFDEGVYAYVSANHMGLKRALRGNQIRKAIDEYIHQTPLRFDEFAMLIDLCHFDAGLTMTAKHQVMFGRSKGGLSVPPEMDKIEAYCREKGIWEEMLAIQEGIKGKRAIQKAADRALGRY